MQFTTRIAITLLGWNFLSSAPAVAAQATPILVNSAIRYALAAAAVGMLLFGISMGVMQFSRNEDTLSRARAFSIWSSGFALAALAGSLLASQLQ